MLRYYVCSGKVRISSLGPFPTMEEAASAASARAKSQGTRLDSYTVEECGYYSVSVEQVEVLKTTKVTI